MSYNANGKLIVLAGPSPGSEYVLDEAITNIGREAGTGLVLNVPGVSRRHARILNKDGTYFLEDIGSSNGTFLNGQRVVAAQQLASGDEIALGNTVKLRFELPELAADMAATRLHTADDTDIAYPATAIEAPLPEIAEKETTPPPRIAVSLASGTSVSHELKGQQVTIGRAADNDIVLDSPIVSRYHAKLVKDGDRYRIDPLPQVSNPVTVNEQPVSAPRQLNDGDMLHIGRSDSPHRVTIAYQESSAVSPVPPMPATVARVGEDAGTMLAADFVLPTSTKPPEFQVAIAGNPPVTYTLLKDRFTIGRAPDNDIVIDSKIISRHQATIERLPDGYQLVPLPDAGNPILYEGRPMPVSRRLTHEDRFRIGGHDPGLMVTMTYVSPAEALAAEKVQQVEFGESTQITIGRDASNDVVIDIPVVSRFHAQVERVGQRYRVRDLRSSNGTFVNDVQIRGDVWLKPADNIRVGPYRFVMGQDRLAQYDESGGLRVDGVNLNKWVRKDLNILQDISLVFKPKEFIVVVGQSGGGKSTLIDAIAGYRPATGGNVYVNDIDVYRNFDAVRNDIGYVPQKDIIHMELTVFQALDYSAQLRMPPDTTKAERHKRIDEVLEDLDIAHRKEVQISGLSGGQQKRVSIGVELLTKPGLFFLDEPTSGLDPGTETALMQLMRRLADQGRTIVLITHATKNVMLGDKVVFLARGGYLAWFGPPDEALAYFDQYRSERDRRARDIEFDEIYAILGDSSKGSPEEWGERFKNHPAQQQYIDQPLKVKKETEAQAQEAAKKKPKPKRRRQVSSLRQFFILSARNIKILTRDRFSLMLMLAAAPLVSLLDVILSVALGNDPFGFNDGLFPNVMITNFLLTIYGVMVGGLAMMREIVKEQDIYRRERLVNLRIFPYVLSKVWVAALLALYAALVYVFVHYLAFRMPGSWAEFLFVYISLALGTMAGMMLGLFASALSPNANSAPLIVILFMLPQIVLGGALVPIPTTISSPISARWSFEAIMAVTGAGSDVAADACWQLPPEQLEQMLASSMEEKDANCNCMGTNALREATCSFPGNGNFYNSIIDEPPPVAPGEAPTQPGDRPPEPVLPPQPEEPADDTDFVALSQYRDDLRAWQTEANVIEDNYRTQLAAYEGEVNVYQAEVEAYQNEVVSYQTELALYEKARAEAVIPAEASIQQFYRDFQWIFVDKSDNASYLATVFKAWAVQVIIIGILFLLILVLQRRKDVN